MYIIKDSAEVTYTEACLLILEGRSKFPDILVLFKDCINTLPQLR